AVQALDEGETLTETFTYTLDDSEGGTDTATLTVTITGENDAPVAGTAITNQNTPDDTTIAPVDISGNFSDPDTSDILTYTAVGLPPGLTLDPNTGIITGTIDNSASQGGSGNDGIYSITVTAKDDNGETVDQVFTWTVINPAPTATDNTADVIEDTTLSDTGDLITDDDGNGVDSDPDGDTLTIAQVQHGSTTETDPTQDVTGDYGTLDWNADGTYTYTVDGKNTAVQALDEGETLTETFTYTVDDSEGGTDTATLTVTITGENDAPVAGTAITNQNTPDDTDITPLDISGNFSDPDTTDILTYTAVGLPPGLTLDPNTGIITGTIDNSASQGGPGNNGIYSITVTAKDDSGETVDQVFTWTVTNPAPDATNNTAGVTEDIALTDDGNLITDNDGTGADNDPDGDLLTITQLQHGTTIETNPTVDVAGDYGTLDWNADGSYTYVLKNSDPTVQALDDGETLTEVFTYTVEDGEGGVDTATLTVTINGTNDAPVAGTAIANQNNPDSTTITPLDVSGNFSDPDTTDVLTYTSTGLPPGLILDPTTGIISGTIDNSASQGGPNNDGVYSITITATDDSGAPVDQVFTWVVTNPVPTATDNSAEVTEDIAPSDSSNLIADDDGNGVDSDPDGDLLTVAQIQHETTIETNPAVDIAGKYGSLDWNADGTYTYTVDGTNPNVQSLDEGETLTETFTYTVDDGDGGTDTATLTVTINGTNDAPVTGTPIAAQDTPDNTIIPPLDISGNFSDPDATDTLTYSAVGLPPGLMLDPATGIISGTIDPSASQGGPGSDGVYSITVTAKDDSDETVAQVFTWSVTNPVPTATDNVAAVIEDTTPSDSGDLISDDDGTGVDSDPDGDTLTVAQVQHGSTTETDPTQDVTGDYGTLDWNADGTYTYTVDGKNTAVQALDDGETLTETFTYTLDDGEGGTDTATLTVTITGENDAPIATTPITDQDSSDNVNISPLDISDHFSDPDTTDVLIYTAVGLPPGLSLDPNTGIISGTLDSSASQGGPGSDGIYPVTITATDNDGESFEQIFNWTVTNPGLTATDNTATVGETVPGSDSGNLLTDDDGSGVDTDIDGDPLVVTSITHDSATVADPTTDSIGAYGTLDWETDGTYSYIVNSNHPEVQALGAGETLTDVFVYRVTDGDGSEGSANLVVTILGENDAPEIITPIGEQSGQDNAPVNLNVAHHFSDPDANDTLTFSAEGLPPGLSIDPTTGVISGVVIGNASQTGPYTVKITATDGKTPTTGTFLWSVTNPSPIAVDDVLSIDENTVLIGNVIGTNPSVSDSDPDGDPLSVLLVNGQAADVGNQITLASGALLTLNSDGTFSYDQNGQFANLNNGETGTDSFTYTISDGQGGTDTATVTLTINGVSSTNPNQGSAGADIITGGDGNDIINGLSDTDILDGGGGNDIINGGSEGDTVIGGTGDDILNGGSGDDDINAGEGHDIVNSGSGHDHAVGGPGNDLISGGNGNDTLYGEGGQDRLQGSDGFDYLDGGVENDFLDGGHDNDVLVGGDGADVMVGGQGEDIFKYTVLSEFGDLITDFEIVSDRIDLSQVAGLSPNALQIDQVGRNTVINANVNGALQTIATLQNVNAFTIDDAHFIWDGSVTGGTPGGQPTASGLALDQADDYLASNVDLMQAFGYNLEAAQAHYSQAGQQEGRFVDTFAEDIYLASHGDLIAAFGYNLAAATQHYIEQGHGEGRTANGFKPELYLEAYPDLKAAFGNDLAAATRHYIESGYAEGRDYLLGFDAAAYIASHSDLIGHLGHDLEGARQHYLTHGYAEGRTVTFEADDYIASHPDLIQAFGYNLDAATEHYITLGASEGRAADAFNETAYLNAYSDLQAAFGSDTEAATQHYIQFGFFEGRTF
ncbi:Ig-like domain-containing protein, partial [Oscillatoria sp. CS-180]|uniref:beta strand repeat-containing protein n=1 Tax=Oscillatoria sp. CS-180 TaxID=3021720 RepID=UPI00232B2A0E